MKSTNQSLYIFLVTVLVSLGCSLGQSLQINLSPTPPNDISPLPTISLVAGDSIKKNPARTLEPEINSNDAYDHTVSLLTYPNHANCTIKVDTDLWKISDVWKEYIIGLDVGNNNGIVLVSNRNLSYLVEHKQILSCQVAWSPAVGFEDTETAITSEIIGDKLWEVWNVGNSGTRIFYWTELRDICFLHISPEENSQNKLCTDAVYKIIESLECN